MKAHLCQTVSCHSKINPQLVTFLSWPLVQGWSRQISDCLACFLPCPQILQTTNSAQYVELNEPPVLLLMVLLANVGNMGRNIPF